MTIKKDLLAGDYVVFKGHLFLVQHSYTVGEQIGGVWVNGLLRDEIVSLLVMAGVLKEMPARVYAVTRATTASEFGFQEVRDANL